MKLCFPVFLLLSVCGHGATDEPAAPTAEALPGASPSPSLPGVGQPGCAGQELGLEARRAVGGAVEKLGLQLFRSLKAGPKQPNIIISPLSISLALAQLTLGARGYTEKLLLRALQANSISCFHPSLGALLQHLTNTSLQVASRLYLSPGFEVIQSFVEDSQKKYGSEPAPLISVEEVNQWVADVTEGHMTNFLPSLPPGVVLMLINAMHFKGEWQTQFDPKSTSKGVFYLENSSSVQVDMMKSAMYPLRQFMDEELEARVACFPFKGNTSFLVVLPVPGRGNVSSLVQKLNISDLYSRLPEERPMQVSLPKFNLQYSQELQDALQSMGLGSLFTIPDLSGISSGPLVVSSVLHASGVELSEEGAEASAATSIAMTRSMTNPRFAVNSPFLFALVDDASLAPLFLGLVTNPAPGASVMQNDGPPADDPHGNRTLGENEAQMDGPDGAASGGLLGNNDVQSDEPSGASASPCSTPSGEEGSLQPPNEVVGQGPGGCPTSSPTLPV
ncbi:alpha-2-antiplasmin-like [Osmerus mordax]|uniref:alpha-2-antiplasmin n=1 Tax=Osmerus mordax TaxID=8014 RepID=UPI0035109316